MCPVATLCFYLERSGSGPTLLFQFQNGHFLTRDRLITALRDGLRWTGIDDKSYCSHSVRIGATTTASAGSIEYSVFKTLGRRDSLTYLQYLKIPRANLVEYTSWQTHWSSVLLLLCDVCTMCEDVTLGNLIGQLMWLAHLLRLHLQSSSHFLNNGMIVRESVMPSSHFVNPIQV